MSRIVSYIREEDDGVGIADSLIRTSVILRTVADDIGMTDDMSIGDLIKVAWAFMIIRQTHN